MGAGHTHADIEINRVEQGNILYFTSGGYRELATGDCVLFWAGMPHELVSSSPGSKMTWAVVPLAWFIQWRLPAFVIERLLQGEWLAASTATPLDDALFARWVAERHPDPAAEESRIFSLEMEAWLRRLARALPVPGNAARRGHPETGAALQSAGASARHIERLAGCMAERYREDLTVAEIASAAGLHPHYAMEVWKHGCGLTLWDYLGRLRLSHAQRLLLTTDWTLERIAEESGFGSRARFYAAFKKQTATSPRRWKVEQIG